MARSFLILLLLAGCADRGRCLEHKTEHILVMQPILMGDKFTAISVMQPIQVCTKYERG